MKLKTEKEKFFEWIDREKSKGLKTFGISTKYGRLGLEQLSAIQDEELFAELNSMEDAPDVPDPEVLGEYSPK